MKDTKWFDQWLKSDFIPTADRISELEDKVEGLIKTFRSSVTGQHIVVNNTLDEKIFPDSIKDSKITVLGTRKDVNNDIYHELFESGESDIVDEESSPKPSKKDIGIFLEAYNEFNKQKEAEFEEHKEEGYVEKDVCDHEYHVPDHSSVPRCVKCDTAELFIPLGEKPKESKAEKVASDLKSVWGIDDFGTSYNDYLRAIKLLNKTPDYDDEFTVNNSDWIENNDGYDSFDHWKEVKILEREIENLTAYANVWKREWQIKKDAEREEHDKEVLDMYHYIKENKRLENRVKELKADVDLGSTCINFNANAITVKNLIIERALEQLKNSNFVDDHWQWMDDHPERRDRNKLKKILEEEPLESTNTIITAIKRQNNKEIGILKKMLAKYEDSK